MQSRIFTMSDNEVESYKVLSVSRHERKAHIYFATLGAPGLSELMLKIEYVKRTYDPGCYKHVEVREGGDKVPVRYSVEMVLALKVENIIKGFGDLQEDKVKKVGEV